MKEYRKRHSLINTLIDKNWNKLIKTMTSINKELKIWINKEIMTWIHKDKDIN